ncbi:MAG: hypothetical protein FWD31_04495 [Planctomycetaceae bacterium]|nr:hypothetical protein [Planctomycetaceae bacterium]
MGRGDGADCAGRSCEGVLRTEALRASESESDVLSSSGTAGGLDRPLWDVLAGDAVSVERAPLLVEMVGRLEEAIVSVLSAGTETDRLETVFSVLSAGAEVDRLETVFSVRAVLTTDVCSGSLPATGGGDGRPLPDMERAGLVSGGARSIFGVRICIACMRCSVPAGAVPGLFDRECVLATFSDGAGRLTDWVVPYCCDITDADATCGKFVGDLVPNPGPVGEYAPLAGRGGCTGMVYCCCGIGWVCAGGAALAGATCGFAVFGLSFPPKIVFKNPPLDFWPAECCCD